MRVLNSDSCLYYNFPVDIVNPCSPFVVLSEILFYVVYVVYGDYYAYVYYCSMPSVLWQCWLGVRKSIRPVKFE